MINKINMIIMIILIIRMQNYLRIFLFFLGSLFCCCVFAWSEGTGGEGGREGGTEGRKGGGFFLGKH